MLTKLTLIVNLLCQPVTNVCIYKVQYKAALIFFVHLKSYKIKVTSQYAGFITLKLVLGS
jgi:hypothetical protein